MIPRHFRRSPTPPNRRRSPSPERRWGLRPCRLPPREGRELAPSRRDQQPPRPGFLEPRAAYGWSSPGRHGEFDDGDIPPSFKRRWGGASPEPHGEYGREDSFGLREHNMAPRFLGHARFPPHHFQTTRPAMERTRRDWSPPGRHGMFDDDEDSIAPPASFERGWGGASREPHGQYAREDSFRLREHEMAPRFLGHARSPPHHFQTTRPAMERTRRDWSPPGGHEEWVDVSFRTRDRPRSSSPAQWSMGHQSPPGRREHPPLPRFLEPGYLSPARRFAFQRPMEHHGLHPSSPGRLWRDTRERSPSRFLEGGYRVRTPPPVQRQWRSPPQGFDGQYARDRHVVTRPPGKRWWRSPSGGFDGQYGRDRHSLSSPFLGRSEPPSHWAGEFRGRELSPPGRFLEGTGPGRPVFDRKRGGRGDSQRPKLLQKRQFIQSGPEDFSGGGGERSPRARVLPPVSAQISQKQVLVATTSSNNKVEVKEHPVPADEIVGICTDTEKGFLRLTGPVDPSKVRPKEILVEALKMVQATDKDYLFKTDQLKSIRQDMVVQNIEDEFTVEVYEHHARLALCSNDYSELNLCLTRLRQLYEKRLDGQRGEFAAYDILLSAIQGQNVDLMSKLARLPMSLSQHEAVKHAKDVAQSIRSVNYAKFFKLHKIAPNLNGLLMGAFFEKMRSQALTCIAKAYKQKVPTQYLETVLGFENGEKCTEWLKKSGAVLTIENNEEVALLLKESEPTTALPATEPSTKLFWQLK